ncbi:U-scoloptoxin(01)-Tl1a [Nematostella vectensis]|nr:U-scoloptoxin(01)-Tl1a [Nematostella vectensis]
MKNLVLLIACFSVGLANDDDFCKEKDAGHYTDPADCAKFYQCDGFHRTFHRMCSDVPKWSVMKSTCDHAKNVDCRLKSHPECCGASQRTTILQKLEFFCYTCAAENQMMLAQGLQPAQQQVWIGYRRLRHETPFY